MDIRHALSVALTDIARLERFVSRRERFLEALDWSLLTEEQARESSMLDDLLDEDLNDGHAYICWLQERAAEDVTTIPGVLRFAPHPRPWHAEWVTLAA